MVKIRCLRYLIWLWGLNDFTLFHRFSINFQTGQNKYDDIAFHFNPWIGQYVYLNSFQKGNWKVKECIPDECFTRGEAFNMFIDINRDGYEVCFMNWFTVICCKNSIISYSFPFQVYVNNLRHYMFKHRVPLKKVTTLRICGDVSIEFFDLCEVSKTNQNKPFHSFVS